jgi:hypothetical protein
MTITPTDKGAMIAGFGVWCLTWLTLFKLDQLPLINRFFRKDKAMGWINRNKTVALICTEAINFGTHGVSHPDSALFALGGTIVNLFMVMLFIPWRCRTTKSEHRAALLEKGTV